MKKTLSLVLAAVMMLAMVVTVSAHDGVTTAVFGTPEAIDGVKDAAWDGAESIKAVDVSTTDLGEENSDTTVWSMWDGEYLYFFAEVKDPTPDGEVKDALWDQDAIGFMVNYDYSTVNTGDTETSYRELSEEESYAGYVNVSPTFADPEHHSRENNTIMGFDKYYDQVKSYVVEIDGGYAVEIRMPLSLYKEFKEGDKIGYEICVNESIGLGTRSGQMCWKFADGAEGSNSWTCPNNFGTLILGAAAATAPAEEPAEEPAEAPAEEVEAPAEEVETVETPATAPQTFDVAVIAAVASVLSLAGFAISKKH